MKNLTNKTLSKAPESPKIILMIICMGILTLFLTSFASAVLADDIVAYYSFEESSGNILDIATGNNPGNLVSGVRGREGKIGDAYFFNGAGDRFNLSSSMLQEENTIAFWVNITTSVNGDVIMVHQLGPNDQNQIWVGSNPNYRSRGFNGTSQWDFTDIVMSDDTWHLIVLQWNNSGTGYANMFVDNVSVGSDSAVVYDVRGGNLTFMGRADGTSDIEGMVDEMGIWNRTLTVEEINELWNNGDGLQYPFIGVNVLLNSPEDAISTINTTLDFNATINPVGGFNLTNATLNIWYNNGTLFYQDTSIVTGNVGNQTNWTISSIPKQTFIWNVLGCATNQTITICSSSSENRTFTVQSFSVVSETFETNVFETDNERFIINITTIPDVLSVDSILVYDSLNFVGTSSCDGGNCTLFVDIDIPLVDASEQQNKSFFWNITVFDGSTSVSVLTDEQQHSVNRTHLEICNATYTIQALNFTAFDEGDSSRIDPFYLAGDFATWLGNGNIKRNNSFSNVSTSELNLCITPVDKDFNVDATIEYNDIVNSSTYNTRNYFFQQDTINNESQDIPLFLLNVDDSTSFILKVQDTNLLPIDDALIIIQKFDPGTGLFTTVSIAKTDDNGQTVGFFKTETVDYRFIIKKDGVILLTTVAGKVVPETAPFTLTFTVGEDEGSPWTLFEDLPSLTKTLTFNDVTGNATFTYIDTSGEFVLGRLILSINNPSNVSVTICDLNSTSTSATLVCGTDNVAGTYTASALITRGSETYLVEQIVFKVETFSSVAGLLGVFLAWLIILVSAFAFKFNEIAGIILVNLAVIAVNIIGLVNFGFLFIFGMMGVSILIIVLMNK